MNKRLTEEADYDIRYSTTNDEVFLQEWLSDSSVRKWFPCVSDSEADVFVRNWIGFSRYKSSLTAVYKNEVIGVATIFLMPYIKVAHICMFYIVVSPRYQRQGVGTSLIRNLKHLAKTRFKLESMHGEIFEGCPAFYLLENQGFDTVVRQENFVKFPEGMSARLIMETTL